MNNNTTSVCLICGCPCGDVAEHATLDECVDAMIEQRDELLSACCEILWHLRNNCTFRNAPADRDRGICAVDMFRATVAKATREAAQPDIDRVGAQGHMIATEYRRWSEELMARGLSLQAINDSVRALLAEVK